jgi:hypothetical protein
MADPGLQQCTRALRRKFCPQPPGTGFMAVRKPKAIHTLFRVMKDDPERMPVALAKRTHTMP